MSSSSGRGRLPRLVAYAVSSFALERIGGDGVYDLYRSTVPLGPEPPRGQLPAIAHARGVTTAFSLPPR